MITITYLNRDGSGFAAKKEVSEGTTVAAFLDDREVEINENTVRLGRAGQRSFTPTADEVLQDGDRLSVVPNKIAGA